MSEPDLAKLSEASELCGIPTDILKLMAADGLRPQVVRGKAGHVYFPRNDVQTWSECVNLLKEQRDCHLRRAASALRRLGTELEAVRNDITEAREYPQQTPGHRSHELRPLASRSDRVVAARPTAHHRRPRSVHHRADGSHPLPRRLSGRSRIGGSATPTPRRRTLTGAPAARRSPVRLWRHRRDQGLVKQRVRTE